MHRAKGRRSAVKHISSSTLPALPTAARDSLADHDTSSARFQLQQSDGTPTNYDTSSARVPTQQTLLRNGLRSQTSKDRPLTTLAAAR